MTHPTRLRLLAEWVDRLWTLTWGGTLLVMALCVGGYFTADHAVELLLRLWTLFGAVQFVDGAGAAVAGVVDRWRAKKDGAE